MKSNINYSIFLLILISISCSVGSVVQYRKMIKSEYQIVDKENQIYFSKFEVTNREYRTFLNELKDSAPELYEKCNIDTTKWNLNNKTANDYGKVYSWHPVFNDYPVVNISHYGAQIYCQWLTEKMDMGNINFRLPYENEFKTILNRMNSQFPSDNADDYICPTENLYYNGNPSIDGGRMMVNARSEMKRTYPKKEGNEELLHIIGNVSEFLQDGRSMGGNWNSYPSEIFNIESIKEPNPLTGFRVWYQVKN